MYNSDDQGLGSVGGRWREVGKQEPNSVAQKESILVSIAQWATAAHSNLLCILGRARGEGLEGTRHKVMTRRWRH
jgi:hypothetical protein